MMIEEFEARTGYKPTPAEYRAIEEQYYSFDGDKDKFCAKWCADARFAAIDAANAINKLLVDAEQHDGKYSSRFLALKKIFFKVNP